MECESDLEEEVDMIEARNEDVDAVMEDPIGNDKNDTCDNLNDTTYTPDFDDIDGRRCIAICCSNIVEGIFQQFFDFLTGPDRRRDPHSITEVVADVKIICIAVQSTENFKNLFN